MFRYVLSDRAHLDTLDLRLLDVYLVLGFADVFMARIAHEERVTQAFVHMQAQQRHYSELFVVADAALEAIAVVRGSFVEAGKPTLLGQIILAGMPQRAEDVLNIRRTWWGNFEHNVDELIDLLLAADPPYTAEAMKLAQAARSF